MRGLILKAQQERIENYADQLTDIGEAMIKAGLLTQEQIGRDGVRFAVKNRLAKLLPLSLIDRLTVASLDRLQAVYDASTPGTWVNDGGYRITNAEGECMWESKHFPASTGADMAFCEAAHEWFPTLIGIARMIATADTRTAGAFKMDLDVDLAKAKFREALSIPAKGMIRNVPEGFELLVDGYLTPVPALVKAGQTLALRSLVTGADVPGVPGLSLTIEPLEDHESLEESALRQARDRTS